MSSSSSSVLGPGLQRATQLLILGDSYSDIGWYSNSPPPTKDSPMGLETPGAEILRYDGKLHDNWVVHLSRSRQSQQHDLRIYDFARSGDTVPDMQRQVQRLGQLISSGVKVEDTALLVIWIGINDIAMSYRSAYPERMAMLDEYLDELYKLGLRHLILFDIPPRIRDSLGRPHQLDERTAHWNTLLPDRLAHWQSLPDTTGRIFSTHATLTDILTNPQQYAFEKEDPARRSGGIWVDGLHLTEGVHQVIADEYEGYLKGEAGVAG